MNFNEIKSISLSLLKKESDVDDNQKAAYSKKLTARFEVTDQFALNEENTPILVKSMYTDLLNNAPEGVDSIGVWIELDTITMENALSLQTLDDIEKYSNDENINPAWELFKMTMIEE